MHDSPIPGVFRLDLPEHGDLTLPAVSKDIHHVTVNLSQLCKTPVPGWFYVPIHVLSPGKPLLLFLPLFDLIYVNLAVIHDVSDQPSGHTTARTRATVTLPSRRTGSVTVVSRSCMLDGHLYLVIFPCQVQELP